MLIFAIVSITLALAFYSVGVWSEQAQHTLKGWHLFMFWADLAHSSITRSTNQTI